LISVIESLLSYATAALAASSSGFAAAKSF